MKLLILTLLLSITAFSFAQDTIVKADGTTYLVNIVDIVNEDLSYKRLNQEGGPVRHMDLKEVVEIRYEDGKVFKQEPVSVKIVSKADEREEGLKSLNSEMLPGYNEIRPYLIDFDGNLTYYDRIGYHQDYLMAYETETTFSRVKHGESKYGCVSKKDKMYRFVNGRAGVSKGKLVIKSPSRTMLFVMAAEDNYLLLCNGLMDYSKYTRSGVGVPGGGFVTTGVNEVAPVRIYYLYDGEELIQFNKDPEELELLKNAFKNCPKISDAIQAFIEMDYPKKKKERQAIIENLYFEMADIFYMNCYIDDIEE